MVYPLNRILLTNKSEQINDTHNESQNTLLAEKPDSKQKCMLYDLIYIKIMNKQSKKKKYFLLEQFRKQLVIS